MCLHYFLLCMLIFGVAVRVCGCVHVYVSLLFALLGTFNPLGHISELKNFRADIAF